MTTARKIGRTGEKAAKKFLQANQFMIKHMNYRRPWGEIDLIAVKHETWYFCEVKTVWVQTGRKIDYNPAYHFTPHQLARLKRTITAYLIDSDVGEEVDWQLVLILVTLDLKFKVLGIEWLPDIN